MGSRVLIVEDNVEVRTSLKGWLGSMFPQNSFVEAATGEEAVALAGAEVPDLVLMDLRLPGMSGIEATRRIKAASGRTNVVILTIHDAQEYRRDAKAAGASAYVLKTRTKTELVPVLSKLLSGRNGRRKKDGEDQAAPREEHVKEPNGSE